MSVKAASHRGNIVASLFLLVLCVLTISSCGRPSALGQLTKESLTLTRQAENRALSPEGRLRIAQDLFEHRRVYEPLIRQPSAAGGDQQTARTLRRSDANTAGAIMHAIAEEHLVNGETDKARAIYYSMLTQFVDEEYVSIIGLYGVESRWEEISPHKR